MPEFWGMPLPFWGIVYLLFGMFTLVRYLPKIENMDHANNLAVGVILFWPILWLRGLPHFVLVVVRGFPHFVSGLARGVWRSIYYFFDYLRKGII